MKILSCNSNRPLAEAISAYLNVSLTHAAIRRFSDMEVFVEILENVRGEDVFIVQSTSYPANDNLMELLVSIDALRRGSARRITAVIRSEEHTSELQSLMRTSYAVFCLKKKK